jgi:hypothetical protein
MMDSFRQHDASSSACPPFVGKAIPIDSLCELCELCVLCGKKMPLTIPRQRDYR